MTPQQLEIIYRGVQRYMERIRLVQQAMRELRPIMLSDFDMRTAFAEEVIKFYQEINRTPWSGVWYDSDQVEWRYTFHGKGLRLVQLITKEHLDWDADMSGRADLDVFDRWWFSYWCQWLLSTDQDLAPLFSGDISSLISEGFDQLEANGLISRISGGYKLISR